MTLIEVLERIAHILVTSVGFIELATGVVYGLLYFLAGNPRHAGLAMSWFFYGMAVVGLYLADQ